MEKSESRVGQMTGEAPEDFGDGWSNEARSRGMSNCISGLGGTFVCGVGVGVFKGYTGRKGGNR